jgi:SAM-dependent methyltransferase
MTPKISDSMSQDALNILNGMYSWKCFTLDRLGRAIGAPASAEKRNAPQELPDLRITAFNANFNLQSKSVLEVGCFEGVHTAGLMSYGAKVTALDARQENVDKARCRCIIYGYYPEIQKVDVESERNVSELGQFDYGCHMGVLYHLLDPIAHLRLFLPRIKTALLLDTHYAEPVYANQVYQSGSQQFLCQLKSEFGISDVFSGVYSHSRWLTFNQLKTIFSDYGFSKFDILRDKNERFGMRLTAIVSR